MTKWKSNDFLYVKLRTRLDTIAADFRSNDRIQERLRKEFDKIAGTLYTGGRRGGAEDAIKRNPKLLPSDSVAQSLAAFHLDPSNAYNKKSAIWISDKLYSNYFNEKTTAAHICFVYSLFLIIKDFKNQLIHKQKSGTPLLDSEKESLAFLRLRGSNYILMAGISSCMELLTKKPIPDRFALSFKTKAAPSLLKHKWRPIVEALLSFSSQLSKPTESSLKNEVEVQAAINSFKSLVQATQKVNQSIYSAFASEIDL